jgi:hypothetical protein
MNWPCFHSWEKWSDPVNGVASTKCDTGYFKVLQLRVCKKCGVAEVRQIGQMRSIESLRDETKKTR